MADRTMLVMPGRKLSVPVVLKRTLQVAMAVALTAAVALALVVGSGWLPRAHGLVPRLRRLARLHQAARHPGDRRPHRRSDRALRLLAARSRAQVAAAN